MKALFTAFLSIFLLVHTAEARFVIIKVNCSETDARLFSNGNFVGIGSAEITIQYPGKVLIEAKKTGYITAETTIYYDNKHSKPDEKQAYMLTMVRDDAWDASVTSDQANRDVEIKTSKTEDEAWRLISEIVTSAFDIIETSDKDAGYMRTSWAVQNFNYNTVRTRVIIKSAGTEPLKYKIKIVSEDSGQAQTSVKDDEKFKTWDRILKKYSGLIEELQTRLR